MEVQEKVKPNKSEKRLAQEVEKLRKARILLGKVDTILKRDGIEAAQKALMCARLKMPTNNTVSKWFEGYRDMLDGWQYGLMPDVVAEFRKFGFRRARTIASDYVAKSASRNKLHFYTSCQQTLDEMAERSRLAISDQDDQIPGAVPSEISLDETSQEQIEKSTKL
jgi:hypothetical protein